MTQSARIQHAWGVAEGYIIEYLHKHPSTLIREQLTTKDVLRALEAAEVNLSIMLSNYQVRITLISIITDGNGYIVVELSLTEFRVGSVDISAKAFSMKLIEDYCI